MNSLISDRPTGQTMGGFGRATDMPMRRSCALIVDDHEDVRNVYAWVLRAAGWVVEMADNGADALLAVALIEPDVILMDLRLPIIPGLDVIRRLKSHRETKHIPIVACSGVDRLTGEPEARAAGCAAFLAKPCAPDVLRNLCETLVAGPTLSP